MANVFITYNPGGVGEAPPIKREKPMDLEGKIPGWLWHSSCREGRIIKDKDEYIQLIADGWVDSPSKINKIQPIIKAEEPKAWVRDEQAPDLEEKWESSPKPKPKSKPRKRRRKVNGNRAGTTQSKP